MAQHFVRCFRVGLFAGVSLLFSSLSACKAPSDANGDDFSPIVPPGPVATGDKGGIVPGEVLDVYVLNDDSFTGRYRVHQDGEIVLRTVGRVQVGGKSVAGAEAAVRSALSTQLSDAKVVVARSASGNGEFEAGSKIEVYLSGKVSKPGKLDIAYNGGPLPTAHQTILQAGGFTRFADKKKVHVLRKGSEGKLVRIPADIAAIERGDVADVSIAGGDIIVVPEKTFGIGP